MFFLLKKVFRVSEQMMVQEIEPGPEYLSSKYGLVQHWSAPDCAASDLCRIISLHGGI